jgi:hypothetical protein
MNPIEATNESIQMLMQRLKELRNDKAPDLDRLRLEFSAFGRVADHVRNAIQICKMVERPKDLALTLTGPDRT